MPSETAVLAKLLDTHRAQDRSKGYPVWLRIRVGRHVYERRKGGTTYGVLAEQLGVSRPTLRKWSALESGGGFSRVVVEESEPVLRGAEPTHAQPISSALAHQTLMLISPCGFSLQGITFEQALHALAVLK